MTKVNCNCIVCAKEFDPDELQNVALSEINKTYFKVCKACFENADPIDDYSQVRQILGFYMSPVQARNLFEDAKSILSSIKKS
jgi:hypothetical protein